jgi:hypothetical protein
MRSLQVAVTVVLALHALALLPQWQRHYFNPRLLRRTMLGMMLGICQGLVIIIAVQETPRDLNAVSDWLGAAVLLHLYLAIQNLLASYAFVRLHRPSAVLAQRMYGGVKPLAWLSAVFSTVAGIAAFGLL